MIHDSLHNWQLYFRGPIAESIKAEIKLAMNTSRPYDKKIISEKLIIRTMSYDLLPKESPDLVIESHKNWIDIQFSINNSEQIDLFDIQDIAVLEYNSESDVIKYSTETDPVVSIKNRPGKFSVFFPGDVHRPAMCCEDSVRVYKGVVKLSSKLYGELVKSL